MVRFDTLRKPLAAFTLVACIVGCSEGTPTSDVTPRDAVPTEAVQHTSFEIEARGHWERLDSALDGLILEDAKVEILAEGFRWSEGPVWIPKGEFLLFSDVPENVVYRWHATTDLEAWLRPSGYTGDTPRGGEPGSNGLILDGEGRLLLAQHGDRRLARLAVPVQDGPWVGDDGAGSAGVDSATSPTFDTVVDAFEGHRFHSPNDLVLAKDGAIYFTDPPYGLEHGWDDPAREMDVNGVYRLSADGQVERLVHNLSRPNGIALAPDGRTLYVANSDPQRAVWIAYQLGDDGAADSGRVFFDATSRVGEAEPGLPDGLKIDVGGHLFATGPGGLWVLHPDGYPLGRLRLPDPTANCAFGGDGHDLYLTSNHRLLRIRLQTRGLGV